MWQSLAIEIRDAARSLRRRPTAAIASAAMLACAIGLTASAFAVFDALVFRPVPFPDPQNLAHLYLGNEHGGRLYVDAHVLQAWRNSRAFSAVESATERVSLV